MAKYFYQAALALSVCLISTLVYSQETETTSATDPSINSSEIKTIEFSPLVTNATREGKKQSDLDQSVTAINENEIKKVKPVHPSEILNRIAGVHVNSVGGEGHMTSIRQPISTSGMYLFLEDGVPTRPSGFFNHNGLYEVNIPQAGSLEVTKGPGSSLYGSDAVAGTINSLTKPSPKKKTFSFSPEAGSFNWQRYLISGGQPLNENHGFRADINLTETAGFRNAADYSRKSGTLRFDGYLNDVTSYKSILTQTTVKQSGVSGLGENDYYNNPTTNLYQNEVGRRLVDATRLSVELVNEPDKKSQYAIIPFYRKNNMDLMPTWMLSYDPNVQVNKFDSFGILSKYRRRLDENKGEIVLGVDIDSTLSNYKEDQLATLKAGTTYVGVSNTGRTNYDFGAAQLATGAYFHSEYAVLQDLKINLGLRFDKYQIKYDDNLSSSVSQIDGTKRYYRPTSQTLNFENTSPKIGLVYSLDESQQIYISQKYAFRIPSVGQLFRSGSSLDTDKLKPINSHTDEIGLRGKISDNTQYELVGFNMIVSDDVVTFIDGATRKVTNAGRTTSTGVEATLRHQFGSRLKGDVTWTKTTQKYQDYRAIVSSVTVNFEGKTVPRAPSDIAGYHLTFEPSDKTAFEFEYQKLGGYYTDEYNTNWYGGHELYNIRMQYNIDAQYGVNFSVTNLLDTLYSSNTSAAVGSSTVEYMPGNPRTYYLGLNGTF